MKVEILINKTSFNTTKFHKAHWLIIILSVILTFFAWYFIQQQVNQKISQDFERNAEQVLELISERMSKYEDALWSGVALINSSPTKINHAQWKLFAQSLHIESKYQGVNGIGVVYHILPENLSDFLNNERITRPNYNIHPKHQQNEFWPIVYISPEQENAAAIGLDMAHENNRYTAAKLSRDTGKSQITGPIVLVQDSEKTPGFLFYAPFYQGDSSTLSQRQKNISGLVYAPFVVKNLLAGTLHKNKRLVDIKIIDDKQIIYNEHIETEANFDSDALFNKTYQVEMYGRSWFFTVNSNLAFKKASINNQPLIILCTGIIIDLLIILIFIVITRTNKRVLIYAETLNEDLQRKNNKLNTEIKEKESYALQAEKSSHAKSLFLANMSHELRTPLNVINGYTQLLSMNPSIPEEDQEQIDAIANSGEHLLSLIEDVLDLSKIESGSIEVNLEKVPLKQLINELQYTAKSIAKTYNLSLEIDEPDDIEVEADNIRLTQVLINLISNAAKYNIAGGSIKICFEKIETNKIKILVIDSGIGIDEKNRQKLFTPFERLGFESSAIEGSGIGLSLSKNLIEKMNGEIGYQPNVTKGSCFWFTLNIIENKEHNNLTECDTPSTFLKNPDLFTLLYVEDNIQNAVLMKAILKPFENVELVIKTDAEAGLSFAEQSQPFLIFMDINLPGIDGFEATKLLKENPNTTHIPVIAMSANAESRYLDLAKEVGISLYLTKPLNINKIHNAVIQHIKQNT